MKIKIFVSKSREEEERDSREDHQEPLPVLASSILDGLLTSVNGKPIKKTRLMMDVMQHRNKGLRIDIIPVSPVM